MVIITHRFKIQQPGLMAGHPQRRRRQQCTLKAVRHAIAQHPPRRPQRVTIRLEVVSNGVVEELLNPLRPPEPAQNAGFISGEGNHARHEHS